MKIKYHTPTKENFIARSPLNILKLSLNNIFQHPVIAFPIITLAFVQILFLEILYFAPQEPLVNFLGPLITVVWSEEFLHYPQNLVLLPKMFYYVQIVLYLFLGTYLLAVTAKIVSILNEHTRVNVLHAFKETASLYVHIFTASVFSYVLFQSLTSGYVQLIELLITLNPFRENMYFWNKLFVLSVPYFQFFLGIVASALLIYVVPIIVIEKQKVFSALVKNFKIVLRYIPASLLLVAFPTLLYLPILTLRNNIPMLMNVICPEIQLIAIVAGLLISMFIDLMIMVSATTFYLFIKENT